MLNMRKILFTIIGFILFAVPSHAFESVIGVSGGVGYWFGSSNMDQSLEQEYKNPYYNPNDPDQNDPNNPKMLSSGVSHSYSTKSNVTPAINFEYQARINQFGAVGVNITNSNPTINFTANGNKIKLQAHSVAAEFEVLGRLINTTRFGLMLGGSAGIGYFSLANHYKDILTDGSNTKQLYFQPKFIIDGEYNLTTHFTLFSRFYVSPMSALLKDITYNTNLVSDGDKISPPIYNPMNPKSPPAPPEPASVTKNTLSFSDSSSLGLNIGVRYRF